MKKNLWILGMAVAALTSCTQSELVDVPETRAIKFDTFVEKGSRADAQAEGTDPANLKDMTGSSIQTFWVFGDRYNLQEAYVAPVFNNEKVQLTSGSWTYDDLRYWQSDMIYRFAAYSNGNENTKLAGADYNSASTSDAPDNLVITGYTSDGTKDLVGAIVNDRRTDAAFESKIKFPFRHMLAKIVVNIKSEVPLTSSFFKIDCVSLIDVYKTGNCKYVFTNSTEGTNPVAWSNQGTEADYTNWTTVDANESKFLLSPTVKTFVFYVVPQEFAKTTTEGVTTYTHAPKLAYRARSYSQDYTDTEVMNAVDGGNITPIHTYNEVFNLDPQVPGGSTYARWAPGYVYIYNVTYAAGTAEEKPIIFEAPTVSTWGNVISAGLPLTPENSGVADQNNNNN